MEELASKDHRIEICLFGLSNKNREAKLFLPGSLSASIIMEDGVQSTEVAEEAENIRLVDATEWFENNTNKGDLLVVKTNCEGSEVDIIDSLIDNDYLKNIYSLLVTFDIRNYKKLQHREVEIRQKLRAQKQKNFCFSDDAMVGISHSKRIENWLTLFGIDSDLSDIETLRAKYKNQFLKYSSKSGLFSRWEIRLKRSINYNNFPNWLKKLLRFSKKFLRLSRERDY